MRRVTEGLSRKERPYLRNRVRSGALRAAVADLIASYFLDFGLPDTGQASPAFAPQGGRDGTQAVCENPFQAESGLGFFNSAAILKASSEGI
jgi:hypothetical protein